MTAPEAAARRPPGRPRDARADEAILRATLDLVGRLGIARTTIAAVAAQAGVGKATIHRRWPTKNALVLASLDELLQPQPLPDTGSLRGDLVEYQRNFVKAMTGPRRDILPSIVGEATMDPELRDALARFIASRRVVLRAVLERGVERGELRADLDVDMAMELFAGPLVYREVMADLPVDDAVAEDLIDLVLAGLAPHR